MLDCPFNRPYQALKDGTCCNNSTAPGSQCRIGTNSPKNDSTSTKQPNEAKY